MKRFKADMEDDEVEDEGSRLGLVRPSFPSQTALQNIKTTITQAVVEFDQNGYFKGQYFF